MIMINSEEQHAAELHHVSAYRNLIKVLSGIHYLFSILVKVHGSVIK